MDAFDFDNVKAEKANAMLRYHRLRDIAKLFRLVEVCLVIVFLSWTSTRLPFAVRISGEYFGKLIAVIASPAFIFVISNVIVITLLAKSGQLSGQTPTVNNVEADLYEKFIRNGENRADFRLEISPPAPEPEDIVYQDKEIICEVSTITTSKHESNESTTAADAISESKDYRRSQSENLKRQRSDKSCGTLRRSETGKCLKVLSFGQISAEKSCLVDKLSNEEFQRKIEAFIAKQISSSQPYPDKI
ncbi:hypothetical protein F0562_006376 [Nyssa sinensis]|uniref:DUF4408 domain-containing protein n=1 Tax=Nyssa sinensis TaxID=561372 RepID=A0A5J5ARA5_9ASTE|nr:hypothetical protein F0562_006376 [Nyssa sinensis]